MHKGSHRMPRSVRLLRSMSVFHFSTIFSLPEGWFGSFLGVYFPGILASYSPVRVASEVFMYSDLLNWSSMPKDGKSFLCGSRMPQYRLFSRPSFYRTSWRYSRFFPVGKGAKYLP